MSDRAKRNLAAAIQTMRDACDQAERDVAQVGDLNACARVMHALNWGMANASSSIECALDAVNDAHQSAIYNATKPKKEAA